MRDLRCAQCSRWEVDLGDARSTGWVEYRGAAGTYWLCPDHTPLQEVDVNHKTAGAWVDLMKALNRLEAAGELPLCDEGFRIVGLSGEVSKDGEQWKVVSE